jgi:hypothetical protein
MRSQNLNPARHIFLLLLAFVITASLSGAPQQSSRGGQKSNTISEINRNSLMDELYRSMPQAVRISAPETNLSLTIRCTKTTLLVGDEIPIEFCISNIGKYGYEFRDRNYDRSGRMDEYHLTAIDERNKVVDPREYYQPGLGGGLVNPKILDPGNSFTKTIILNSWALINSPGRYEVTGRYPVAGSSPPITITVKPRSETEMQAYIDDLTEQIRLYGTGGSSSSVAERQIVTFRAEKVQKLMYTCDAKAIPILLDCLFETERTGWESDAFLRYLPRNEAIRRSIIDRVQKSGSNSSIEYILSQYYRHMRGAITTAGQFRALAQ